MNEKGRELLDSTSLSIVLFRSSSPSLSRSPSTNTHREYEGSKKCFGVALDQDVRRDVPGKS